MYDCGTRISGPLFSAFCFKDPGNSGPHIGFTVPRAIGCAVVRNCIKRRFREAVRARLDRLTPQWSIVFNPRRNAAQCPFSDLEREIDKLFLRCSKL